MFVTISGKLLRQLQTRAKDGKKQQALYGNILDDGTVFQITSIKEGAYPFIGYFVNQAAPSNDLLSKENDDIKLLICRQDSDLAAIRCFGVQGKTWFPFEHNVIEIEADFYSRIQGLFDTGYLFDKTVTVIGLGTGGGLISLELAKNGVGHFNLVDFDRLEVHNIARHVCGLRDIGRYKTRAMANLLREHHPDISIDVHEFDILKDQAQLHAVVQHSDLVIAATDSEGSKRVINEICWPLGIPAIYGAAYDRAFGGDIIRVIPADTACYECVFNHIAELFETAPQKSEIDYAAEDISKVVAEPGLGIDVAFVGLIMAKVALLTLLRGSDSTLEDVQTNWIMWGNQAKWIFDSPFQALLLDDVPQNPTCPVCNYPTFVEQTLAMTVEEAEVAGNKLVRELKQNQAHT